jgi:hypothetical protein
MSDDYYADLGKISLSDFKAELESGELLPSRKMLGEDIDNRFKCMRNHGMKNLDDLLAVLKTTDKIKKFSRETGLPEEYLTILRREIMSSQPKPVNLRDFPGISKVTVGKLEKQNIKNTKQLYQYIKTDVARRNLQNDLNIPHNEVLELAKLTDVVRIKWVGANFARLLVDSCCDTVEKVSKADYKELYDAVVCINDEKKYFRGKFGLHDMKLAVIAAKKVPNTIEY